MPEYPNRKYVIITTAEVEDVNFEDVLETNVNSLMFSKDCQYTFVKYEEDKPSFLNGNEEYSNYEIKEFLNNDKGIWRMNDEEKIAFKDNFTNVVNSISWKKTNPFS